MEKVAYIGTLIYLEDSVPPYCEEKFDEKRYSMRAENMS